MFIQTQSTPNPLTLKFLPERTLLDKGQVADFTDRATAEKNPLARQLFAIEGVEGVFLAQDFISITKSATIYWDELKPNILSVMMDFLTSGEDIMPQSDDTPQSNAKDEARGQSDNEEMAVKINALIEERIRPIVAQDGGDITLDRFEKGVVYLHMRGACAGCPSSMITLKHGVENLLRYYEPSIERVEATTILS